jgi:hypothetical protein
LNAGYFSDDFLFFYDSPPPHFYDHFFSIGLVAHAYRPLEAIFLTLVQRNFGFQTWPIHLVAIGAHIYLCLLTVAAAAYLRFSPAERFLAAILVLITQAGPAAVLGNDTLSQAMSAALGLTSVFLLYFACFDERGCARAPVRWRFIGLSVLCLTTSFFFKETALGFSLILFIIALAAAPHQSRLRSRLTLAGRILIPYASAGMVYVIARIHAGGQIAAADAYRIGFGLNVVRNFTLFLLCALDPVSSVSVAVAVQTHKTGTLAVVGCITAFIAGLIVAGIVSTPRKRLVTALLGCFCAALFPAFLLSHVSELYFYNAVPFAALIFSLALGQLWSRHLWMRPAVAVCVALLLGYQVAAVRQKSLLMSTNGRQAGAIVAALTPFIKAIPKGGRVTLVQSPVERMKYSVYLLQGLDVLEFGVGRLGPILGRPDISVTVAEANAAPPASSDSSSINLFWDGATLRRYDVSAR